MRKNIHLEIVKTYKTVAKRTEGLYKEKGSKFIGIAVQCFNEEEAKQYIAEIRNEHHQARHWCYAYRFGLDKKKFRANDDGEPSNSAGAPILGQIQSFNLSNVLIVVVRYYGGTKLGVGGLINAYRTGAKEALEAGKIIECEVFKWIKADFEYEDMPKVMKLAKDHKLIMKNQVFDLNCTITLGIALDKEAMIIKELDDFKTTEINELGIY